MSILAAYAVPHPPLIVPAVGKGEETAIQSTIDAYEEVARRIAEHQPDTIIVTSPHAPAFSNGFFISNAKSIIGGLEMFGAENSTITATGDRNLAELIASLANQADIPIAMGTSYDGPIDHATYVPLYFLRDFLPYTAVVRVGLSGLPARKHHMMGRCFDLASNMLRRRVVMVASGDLSHKLTAGGPYGFHSSGPRFDETITRIFESGNLDELFTFNELFCEEAAECGLRSFQMMAGALADSTFTSELLSYEGPFGVGYGVACFEVVGEKNTEVQAEAAEPTGRRTDETNRAADVEEDADADSLVALARASVERFVTTGHPLPLPADLPSELIDMQAGVFVSLHEHGELRGCIGTIVPTRGSIAQEIVSNAIAACSNDPRFHPVQLSELEHLSYSVDVLFPPEPIDSPAKLDPQEYGVIVTKGNRRGLLLPNLEGIDTVEQQVAIAKQKAGIALAETNVELERFKVVRHTAGGEARAE